tara:strand:+ start:1825 stop:2934 length:1110 start_codon:yes stop_codon:yes gene_type:complete
MNQAQKMYALSADQIATAIESQLHLPEDDKNTLIVEGDTGCGKSSILDMLAKRLPKHKAIYFDCTTKADAGDLMMPKFKDLDGNDYVTFATNEELGVHLKNQPLIIMIDEAGKNKSLQNPMNRLFQERMIGMNKLHPDTLVFATTNLGAEGLGDMFMPHTCNRVTFVRMRKPTNMEWIRWGINSGINHTMLGWTKDNPHLFYSFDDVPDPADNPYIYHPKEFRRSFCTPRSLHKASNWLNQMAHLDDQTLVAALMGTIGDRGAMDLMAYVKLANQLPSRDSIKNDPTNAVVPSSAAAVCMVVYRTLATMEPDYIDAWMDYMPRLDAEAQGMFANGVRTPKYAKQSVVMTNKKFTKWAMDNNYMFAADKK